MYVACDLLSMSTLIHSGNALFIGTFVNRGGIELGDKDFASFCDDLDLYGSFTPYCAVT